MVDPLKVLWVLTNSTYLVSKFLKLSGSESEEPPFFEKSLYEVSVKEDAELHRPIITVAAENLDEAATIQYEVAGGDVGGVFEVDRLSGAVSLAKPLDYESRKKYELRLSVKDGKSVSYTTLQVTVLDTNDNPPVFQNTTYHAQITEEDRQDLPKKILQVNVSDADIDRQMDIVYSLTGPGVDTDEPSSGKFSINKTSGEIYVLKPLDRDLPHGRPQWRFTVFAQDEGGEGLVGYSDIHVTLKDVNDNAPVFPQPLATSNVTENGTADLVVLTMKAVDYDDPTEEGNARLTYTIEKNVLDEQTGTPIFKIEPHTGLIRTNVCCLDREKTPDYTLQVVAADGGGLKGTGTVSIVVTDINDMPPVFTKEEWVTEVAETLGRVPAATILTVNVVDPDESNDFYYQVVDGSGPGTDRFTMVRNPDGTGSLRLKAPLDFEDPLQRSGFRFKIQGPSGAVDKHHVAYSWVMVHLRDINDNSPQFSKNTSTVSLQEDAALGTLVDIFTARDPDQAGEGRVTMSIARESDSWRHFHISDSGRVTLQRQLDRETQAVHKLLITASDDGDPPLTATASLTVNVLDVNDNAPTLLEAYSPILVENSSPKTFLEARAQDVDDHAKGHGPPYTFSLDPAVNNSLGKLFHVQTHPRGDDNRGIAVISSLVTFDREELKEYLLPILIQDSGDPVMVGTSTVTVVIGDLNDHTMAPGAAEIHVYRLEGTEEALNIGRVYVEDLDDWDLADKTFLWEGTADPHFRLERDTGWLRMTPDTPPGRYKMVFRVKDHRHSASVLSNVTVNVEEITRSDVEHSAVVTLLGVTATDFIRSTNSSWSRLERFQAAVAQAAGASKSHVTVFSVHCGSHFPPQTDVRFFVKEDSQYFEPVRLHGVLLMNREEVESALSLNISRVGASQCSGGGIGGGLCEREGSCVETLSFTPTQLLVDGNSTQWAGPTVNVSTHCSCALRDFTQPDSCQTTPCFNRGTCLDTSHGPRCSCPENHDGPRCQRTTRGFQGAGWAWYPSLQACSPSHLSLEVLTAKSEGLILYNGPLGPPNPNAPLVTDFISLEVVDGLPRLLLDLGAGTVGLAASVRLDDGEWHRLDVLWDTDEVRLVVDFCQSVNITDTADGDWTEGDCLASAPLPLFDTQLDVQTPLQLGGRSVKPFQPLEYRWAEAPRAAGLDGCLKNVYYNGQLLDLGEPALSSSSTAGCPHTMAACKASCSSWSQCEASLSAARCICPPGFSGPSCSTPTVPSTLRPGSFVKYALNFEPLRYSTSLQMRFRTRQSHGELFRLVDQHAREFIVLEIQDSKIRVKMNLNGFRPKEEFVSLEHQPVDDGRWHLVKVKRHGSVVILQLDGGEGRGYNESFVFRGHQLIEVDKQEGVFAGGAADQMSMRRDTAIVSFGDGCLDDIRLDGRLLPLPPASNGSQWAQVAASSGLDRHCHSRNVCADIRCPDTFLCQDLWNDYVCSCGDSRSLSVDGRSCTPREECLAGPCLNGGLCLPQDSRPRYRCDCPDGFWGQNCELSQERQSLRLGLGALLTIVGCLLLILVLVALFVAYHRRREAPAMKKAPDDDVRENIISYNDEGGGEDDLNAFDLLPLKVPVKVAPADRGKLHVPELIEETSLGTRIESRRRRADCENNAPPYDDLRNYAYEGNCDSALGSLSSLESCAGAEEAVRYVVLGPRFAGLVDIYASSLTSQEGHLEATV